MELMTEDECIDFLEELTIERKKNGTSNWKHDLENELEDIEDTSKSQIESFSIQNNFVSRRIIGSIEHSQSFDVRE